MLKQQLVKVKQLKEYIDNEINNVKFQTRKTMGMRKRIC
ncbi:MULTISPECIES: hypothetical protein [Bacillus cereus group]|uniref:Uncharacterized protein n=2 Tax=Bacillus TaxID=1386 RepID=A0AAE9TE81_BACCE|nr:MULTISPECIES: hypothetical protein [Bacillus cereus group]UYW72351.1 hypothetical protein OK229_27800 [Bacillus cereus]WLG17028.1 hypothetical protein QM225_005839 [Bacillus cereus]